MIRTHLHPNRPPHTRRWLPLPLVLLLALVWATGCGPSEEELAERMASVRAELAATLQGEALSPEARQDLEGSRTWRALQERYSGEEPETVWVDGEGPRERVDELIAVLGGGAENGDEGGAGEGEATAADAGEEGDDRDTHHYGADHLAELRDRARQAVEDESAEMGRHLADLELAASYAFLTRAFHNIEGRVDPRRLSVGWYMEGRKAQPLELLSRVEAGAAPAEVLADQEPKHEDYRRLQEARDRYRAVVADGGWPKIPEEGEALKEGAEGPRVAALRERLALDGDLAAGGAAEGDAAEQAAVFDEDVTEAVRRFQERHGLEVDGVAGGSTLDALNVPAEERLRTIELNLERWRWMPAELGDHHVLVNIPEYRLRVMRGGDVEMSMNVIVGERMNQTPVFSDTITHLVLNPAWNIPESIAEGEVLPKLRSDPGHAASQGIEVVGPDGERMPPAAVLGRRGNGARGNDGTGDAAGEDDGEDDEPGFFARVFGGGDDDDEGRGDNGDGDGDAGSRQVTATHLPQGYRLRQAPGAKNPLGQVKFMFPNEHNIYLHDTPTDHLFEQASRGFSHGCIRLERPLELADYLLQGDPDWDAERIRQTVGSSDQETTVHLPEEIPVHLTYFTARVGEDGRIYFNDDLYGHDQRLAEALEAQASATLDLSRLRAETPKPASTEGGAEAD